MRGFFFKTLEENRDKLIDKWVKFALSTYPSKSEAFFTKQSDPFLNPVGNVLRNGLRDIFDELLKDKASEDLPLHVDAIVRVRAVQDFSPSGAVRIFWKLKDIVEEVIDIDSVPEEARWEVKEFLRRVDDLCFLAFDIFMKCREKLWELKTKEFQAGIRNILRHYQVNLSSDQGNN
jgi:hypothetical protein